MGQNMTNGGAGEKITGIEVKSVYEKIEKSKEGVFFVNTKKEPVTNNCINGDVANFFMQRKEIGRHEEKYLHEDAMMAGRLAKGLL